MSEPDSFLRLVRQLQTGGVRFVVHGVSGANYYAESAGLVFITEDRVLFLPLDPDNLLRAWQVCEAGGHELWCGSEPLGRPLDRFLADKVVATRALVRAESPELRVDLSLVMKGFEFDDVWPRRHLFRVEGEEIPVAALSDIVRSKAAVGRPKDRLFLAAHEDALRQLLGEHDQRE